MRDAACRETRAADGGCPQVQSFVKSTRTQADRAIKRYQRARCQNSRRTYRGPARMTLTAAA